MTTAIAELRRMAKRFTKAAGEYDERADRDMYYFGCAQTYDNAALWCRERAAELAKPKKKARRK